MPHPLDSIPDDFLINRRPTHAGNTDVPQFVVDCLEADADSLARLHPDAQARPRALQTLMSSGSLRVLNRAVAEPRPRDRVVVLSIPCLGLTDVVIGEEILALAPALLDGGCWALIDLAYQPSGSSVPYAVTHVEVVRTVLGDPERFVSAIGALDSDHWERLLMESIGFKPDAFTARQRSLLICRLAPLVEPNLHLVELGQPGTGKSTTLVATSARTIVKTGGQVSLPELFKNLRTGLPGLVARYDLVGLDEIQHMDVTGGDTVTAALKEYLESGTYTRGGITTTSQAGLCLMGNIPVKDGVPDPSLPYTFTALPRPLHDVALFDRLHGALPDWEMPTIEPSYLYRGRAVALDILAEHFHHQRRTSHADSVASTFDWNPGMTQRDVRAVARMSSAILKLRFPSGRWGDAVLREAVTLASD